MRGKMKPTKNELILSCQRALLGAIPYKLRGLTVKLENENVVLERLF
jgi:hypothetical protein